MLKMKQVPQLVAAATIATLLCAGPLQAQTTGVSTSNSNPASANSSAGNLSDTDRKLMENIAQANIAEIDAGKMAVAKGQDPKVKQFARKIIDDHTTALNELQQLAQSKGVTLPIETDILHKTMAATLDKLTGKTFDAQYIRRIGIDDHERTDELLKKTISNASDPDLKAYAQKNLAVVDQHLQTGQKMKDTAK